MTKEVIHHLERQKKEKEIEKLRLMITKEGTEEEPSPLIRLSLYCQLVRISYQLGN